MRALVTGGSGFIGSNVVSLLYSEGYEVVVLDNLSSGYSENLDDYPEVELVVGDVRDEKLTKKLAAGADVIFHLAASVGNMRSIENPIEDAEVNLIGTLRVLEAAKAAGVPKIVHTSSAAIYGQLRTMPIREDHPLEPDSPYGASKLAGEKACLAYARMYAMNITCLRYFNVYGINQRYDAYGNVVPIFAQKMLTGQPITVDGDGEQTRDFVNVGDVAMANYKAAMAPGATGAYNIGSGERITINSLVELLSKVSGVEPVVRHGSPRAGDIQHSLADISAAAAAFGFAPAIKMADGLRNYVEWLRSTLASGTPAGVG